MNNTGEYSNIFLSLLSPLLSAIITIIVEWINRVLKSKRNIYASHKYLFCNSAIYNKIMLRTLINVMFLALFTIMSAAIGIFLKVYPFGIIEWLVIYSFTYVLQVMIMRKGYYGLDKYGNRKNYGPFIYFFIGIIDIDLLFIIINNDIKYIITGYVIEVLLIIFFAFYIANIKKVKYCERVVLVFKHKKAKTVAIENLKLEEDGSVIIYNQDKNSVQISNGLIKKKKAIYSNEYIQWKDKMLNLKMDDKIVKENNKDIRWNWVILIAIIPIVISTIDLMNLCTYENCEISGLLNLINLNNNMISDLFSQQMTISTIFIAVASLVINNIDDRFIGASTKYVLFKRFIFYFNYITITLILLALNVSSFVAYLFQSKWGLITAFIASMIWLFDLLKLTYYLLSKKSKIYFIILKKLDAELEKKQDFLIYKSLMDKLNTLVEKDTINGRDLIHDSYFVEEMLILYKLKSITYALGKDNDQIIEEAKKYYINREERTGDKLRKLFEQYKGTDCTKTAEWIAADLEKKDRG